MSYMLATAPASGPPGPLRIPGVQLGAVEPHSHRCTCQIPMGDFAGMSNQTLTLGAAALAGLYLLMKKRR